MKLVIYNINWNMYRLHVYGGNGILTCSATFSEGHTASIFMAEHEGSMFLRKVDTDLHVPLCTTNQKTTMDIFTTVSTSNLSYSVTLWYGIISEATQFLMVLMGHHTNFHWANNISELMIHQTSYFNMTKLTLCGRSSYLYLRI
jgi:hypothetical protein